MIICETNRLRIKHFSAQDGDFIVRLFNEPSFIENIEDKKVRNIDDAIKYLTEGPMASYKEFTFGLFLVELKETGEPIGMSGLLKRPTLDDVELGFSFLKEHWSMGYAQESAIAVLKNAHQDIGLEKVIAITKIDNFRSSGLLEKLGFKQEGMIELYDEDNKLFGLKF